jgi:hypothetical protein
MQLYRHRMTTFHRTSSASTEIASITPGKRIPYPHFKCITFSF